MLPFLKNKDDGVGVGPVEIKVRESDDGFDMLDAVCSDLCSALGVGEEKHSLVKAALQSFAEYIFDKDEKQDQETMKG